MQNFSGAAGEKLAVEAYEKSGFRIIAKNFSNKRGKRIGEIDFIALKGQDLRFVEVKTRFSHEPDLALEEINHKKQLKIILAAKYFLMLNPRYLEFNQHFDAAIVLLHPFDKIPVWIKIYSDVIEDMLKH